MSRGKFIMPSIDDFKIIDTGNFLDKLIEYQDKPVIINGGFGKTFDAPVVNKKITDELQLKYINNWNSFLGDIIFIDSYFGRLKDICLGNLTLPHMEPLPIFNIFVETDMHIKHTPTTSLKVPERVKTSQMFEDAEHIICIFLKNLDY